MANQSSLHTELFIDGAWKQTRERGQVRNKFTGEIFSEFACASAEDVEAAVAAAIKGSSVMAEMPLYRRAEILRRTSELLLAHKEEIAICIAKEGGKPLKFARLETDRAVDTFRLASEEAGQIHGETIPIDAVKSGEGLFGFWQRRPVGVVGAITPFNFPLNLVAHKVAPALAAGNSVVLKPAEITPLTAGLLCSLLTEAGLPAGALNLVHGPGETVGDRLVRHRGVNKITFTGSAAVGRSILAAAGIKKVTLELGNNSPVVIAADADLKLAAAKCALGANYHSGQVCISTQRIYIQVSVYDEFRERLRSEVERLIVGDPLDETVDVGPLIDVKEADRVMSWIAEARSQGATLLHGGRRERALVWPMLVENVNPQMKIVCQEVFGPVASLIRCESFEEALRQADDTEYGLQAAIFTRDIDRILSGIKALHFGGVIVNDAPHLRPDMIPYGGNRQSGLGREGLRFAIEEMTNIQTVMIRTKPAFKG